MTDTKIKATRSTKATTKATKSQTGIKKSERSNNKKQAPKSTTSKTKTSASKAESKKQVNSEYKGPWEHTKSSRAFYAVTRRFERMHQHLNDYRPKSIKAMANFLGYDISEADMKKQTRPWMSTPVKSAKLKTAKNK